ncbi:MAG: hypothetical protein RI841_03920 [Halomonas sp.]|uniref:hypothetical protein n=1 Tax=Halomonas sp. TaxID=1486246 RepID=UPI00286FF467|nr:hypothetical protein [Halomonas sp.]MDR9438634.1 hypothetical protein [Halomonas sp.]
MIGQYAALPLIRHRQRFTFFQTMLRDIGAHWSASEARSTGGLKAGNAYFVGTANVACEDERELDFATLREIAQRHLTTHAREAGDGSRQMQR